MPRLVNANPKYRLHKASGQAVVTLNGQDVYLGPHGSSKSRKEYDRVVSEWLSRGRQRPGENDNHRVADVIVAYLHFAKGYYTGEAGAAEYKSFKLVLRILRRVYGEEAVQSFGPLALQVVREAMVNEGWSRG